jgi:hypothetical protein
MDAIAATQRVGLTQALGNLRQMFVLRCRLEVVDDFHD